MHYKVSVIVPVHNVAPYIELCANSLFNQTLEELQFVFVNDHTEDYSMEILERLLDAYPNRRPHTVFLTLEEERGGSPQSRTSASPRGVLCPLRQRRLCGPRHV